MDHSIHQFFILLSNNTGLVKVGTVLFFAIVAQLIEWLIFLKFHPRLCKSRQVWDDALLHALHPPFTVYLWVLTLTIIAPLLVAHFKVTGSFFTYISLFRKLAFVLCLFWFLMRFIAGFERSLIKQPARNGKKRDQTSVHAMGQVARIFIVIAMLLISMQTVGIKIGTLLAAGGIGGLAISFAAKDTLANFIGGLMIYWDRPFSVGDWIRSPDRNIEGTVEKIGWRLTQIRTFDKRPLYVPNGVFSTISVENASRMTNRRFYIKTGVRYCDAEKIDVITRDIKVYLQGYSEVDQNQSLAVNFIELADSSLTLMIYGFTKTTSWFPFQDVQQIILLKVLEIVESHGASCAFPTTTLDIPEPITTKPV